MSLGQSAKTVWAEVCSTIGPQLERVLLRGESTTVSDALLPLLRDGVIEDQYWSYSYSPVIDAHGSIVGVLDVAHDNTEAVLNRRERDRAVEIIRRSEDRFRLLIERASVGINIGDSTGALTYINHTLLRLIGYTAEEVREGTVRWDQLTPPKYLAADRRALARLKETGVATPYEKSYRAKDGHLVPVQIGAVLIHLVFDWT